MRTIASALFALLVAAITPALVSAGEHHKAHSSADPTHQTSGNASHAVVPCTPHNHSFLQRLHNALASHSHHNDSCTPVKAVPHATDRDGAHVADGADDSHVANHDQVAIEDVDHYLEHYFTSDHSGHDGVNDQWEIRAAQVEHDGEHFVLYHATNVHDAGLRYTLLAATQHTRCPEVWEPVR
jgi:hypothetical protein